MLGFRDRGWFAVSARLFGAGRPRAGRAAHSELALHAGAAPMGSSVSSIRVHVPVGCTRVTLRDTAFTALRKKTPHLRGRPMGRPAEGAIGAKRFGQLRGRSVFNTPTGYHPNSFTLSVCLMWASRKPECGGEGREPPGTHSECRTGATGSPNESRPRADPGPASGRVSPDPGASTPGTSARGQRAVHAYHHF